MTEIYQNVKKVDYEGVEGKSFKILNEVAHCSQLSKCWLLGSALKRFKASSGMAIKNIVRMVLRNPPTCASNE